MELDEWRDLQILEELEDWSAESSGDEGTSHVKNKTSAISLSSVVVGGNDHNSARISSQSLSRDNPAVKMSNSNNQSEPESDPAAVTQRTSDHNVAKTSQNLLQATFVSPDHSEVGHPPPKPSKCYRALALTLDQDSKSSLSTPVAFSSAKRLTLTSSTEQVGLVEEENVAEALLTFALTIFGPLWALGMMYWHYSLENWAASALTAVGLLLGVVVTSLVYIIPKSSPFHGVWAGNKFVALLCLIPGLAPIILSLCNVVFSLRETSSRTYVRPWRGCRGLFLAESLSLAFPLACLYLLLIVEDSSYLHTYLGYTSLSGIITFTLSITWARFRYDSQFKVDRFGTGPDLWFRFICLWANKCLWIATFTLTLLCFRLAFPEHGSGPVIGGIGAMFVAHELPILALICAPALLGGLMLIPQFTALTILLIWVNLDPGLYSSETGSGLLGAFFWSELFILSGWLYDRCTGREIDIFPFYPHFLGDIITTNLRP